jgi:hypothetical protein
VEHDAGDVNRLEVVLVELVKKQFVGTPVGEIRDLPFLATFQVEEPDIVAVVHTADENHPFVIRQHAVAGEVKQHVVMLPVREARHGTFLDIVLRAVEFIPVCRPGGQDS